MCVRAYAGFVFSMLSVAVSACLIAIWIHSYLANTCFAFPIHRSQRTAHIFSNDGQWGFEYSRGDLLLGYNPGLQHGGEWSIDDPNCNFGSYSFKYFNFYPAVDLDHRRLMNSWGTEGITKGKAPRLSHWKAAGFVLQRGPTTLLLVPIWFPVTLSISPALLLLSRWYFIRRRRQSGRCRKCGYDLRGTPLRCPECGEVPLGKLKTKTFT